MSVHPHKYKTGLVIGRFQPFHFGHSYLIERALELCDTIIIGIGSSNIADENNLYDSSKREKFLQEYIAHTNIEDRVQKVVYIEDVPDDNEWYTIANKQTGSIDVVIGDNEWVNGIYEDKKIPVVRIGHYKRDELQGKTIRKLMKEKRPWKDRVPSYVAKEIEE